MRIELSNRAIQNLDNIYTHIEKDKPNSAVEFKKELIDFFNIIAANPSIGKDCVKKRINQKCKIAVFRKNYLVIYKIFSDFILIQMIKNTKQFK